MKSLTVGIPAYNEEKNIGQLLDAIQRQIKASYRLEKIIIILDGSTDKTKHIIREAARKDHRIKFIHHNKRKGKIFRLNELYMLNQSDFLVTLDADIVPADDHAIEQLVNALTKSPADIAAANLIPVRPFSFLGKIIYTNNIIWKKVGMQFKRGNHISNLYGQANILKKEFAKSFKYPIDISCDEEYLYIKAGQANGFCFAKKARFYFKSPETIRDYVLQSRRFLKEREFLVPYFGKEILKLHNVPLKYKVNAVLQTMKISPLYTILAILLNLLIKITPYNDTANSMGKWIIAESTKSFGA